MSATFRTLESLGAGGIPVDIGVITGTGLEGVTVTCGAVLEWEGVAVIGTVPACKGVVPDREEAVVTFGDGLTCLAS